MYSVAAAHWVRHGWARHLITALATNGGTRSELGWLGFAPCVVDAVRELSIELDVSIPDGLTIERANSQDLEGLTYLDRILEDHLREHPNIPPPGFGGRPGREGGELAYRHDQSSLARTDSCRSRLIHLSSIQKLTGLPKSFAILG